MATHCLVTIVAFLEAPPTACVSARLLYIRVHRLSHRRWRWRRSGCLCLHASCLVF